MLQHIPVQAFRKLFSISLQSNYIRTVRNHLGLRNIKLNGSMRSEHYLTGTYFPACVRCYHTRFAIIYIGYMGIFEDLPSFSYHTTGQTMNVLEGIKFCLVFDFK